MRKNSKKLSLDVETLLVESFATEAKRLEERGTVHGHAACTCFKTCLCPSAYYYCGDGYHTIYSCDYSYNESCGYVSNTQCQSTDCL